MDMNLFSLRHLVEIDLEYRHGEVVINLGNPIYINKRYKELYRYIMDAVDGSFFGERFIRQQIVLAREFRDPRTILHTYRVIILPIHFLEKRFWDLNVFRASERLGIDTENMEKVCMRYRGSGASYDADKVLREIDELAKIHIEISSRRTRPREETEKRIDKIRKIYLLR
ncbi:MAG: hypothetical protein C0179_05120 [Fervidicoccus sp.]|nr:MAG: hypothetical protein C0179_05120 [Fervidicoccus sp.]